MRWMWIDEYLEFRSKQSAVAVKNTTISDLPCDEYMPGLHIYPHSLIIEGMAQTAGLLVGEASDFKTRVVLAKVSKSEFYSPVLAGSRLIYTTKIEDLQPDGAIVTGQVHCKDELQADIELMFAHLDERFPDLFEPHYLLGMLRLFGVYDVAVDEQGNRLEPPAHLLEAEQTGWE